MFSQRIKKLYDHRLILWDMTIKQLKAKYSGSRLGLWWAIVTPLILASSINLIFSQVFKIEIKNYTFFVLSGMIPWMFFSGALSESASSFVSSSAVLKQGIFPREFIPVSVVLGNFLSFLIGFAILLPLFIVFKIKVITALLFLILPLSSLLVFTLGLGFFLSCWNVFLKDVPHLLSIMLMIWFWITPIFYSVDMISPPYRLICLLNPATYYVISYQQILFEARSPDFTATLISFLVASFFLVSGYLLFLKKEPALLKRV